MTPFTRHSFTTDLDISSPGFWRKPFVDRDKTFAQLRANAPASWHPPFEDPAVPPEVHREAGFWAVTRHADIQTVSQNYELFSSQTRISDEIDSANGQTVRSYFHPVPLKPQHPNLDQPPTFLVMGPPQHTKYRQAISRAFTPKSIAQINDKIHQRAAETINDVVGARGT